MKRILSLVLIVLSTSVIGFANNEQEKATPVLISAFEPTGKITEINDDTVDLLVGDIVDTYSVDNAQDFEVGQRVRLETIEKDLYTMHPYFNISNVKHNTMGTIIEKYVYVNEEKVELDVNPHSINGTMMIPLAETLRALDYEVTWNNETRVVEIKKGPQWTSITIGENAYFKNRMAPRELSHAPIIVDGRTLVPAEFFNEVLDLGMEIKDTHLYLSTNQLAKHSGYIQSIEYKANDQISITISSKKESDSMMDQTIIHASVDTTYFNNNLEVGNLIEILSPPIMTMSIPGQTSAIVIY